MERFNNIKYLNHSSTAYEETNEFNLSDAFYNENKKGREEIKHLENKIKNIVNAPDNAYVVFDSGATEGIATAIHWVSKLYPSFKIVGSTADHSAVLENCKLYNVAYKQLEDIEQIDKINMDRVGGIFITHVDSKTGEINNINNVINKINNKEFLQYGYTDNNYNIQQYKPLIILDATQSILKVPIDMQKQGINICFWSDHKLGGSMGRGCMVIAPDAKHKFVPLIAGAQNNGLRGGSLSVNTILKDAKIYNYKDNLKMRKNQWLAACDYLEHNNVLIYKPKKQHLYNTILIDTKDMCPYSVVDTLAKENIYMSPKSACMVESKLNNMKGGNNDTIYKNEEVILERDEQYSGKPFENAVRMSFINGNILNKELLDKIISVVKTGNEQDNENKNNNEAFEFD